MAEVKKIVTNAPIIKSRRRAHSKSPSFRDGAVIPSEEQVPLIRELQGGSNKIILSFSGKDSLAAWLFLLDHGFEVIPYWLYMVPGLSFDEQMIEYYEKHFKTRIIRYPHPFLYDHLSNYSFQTPERWGTIWSLGLPAVDYNVQDIQEEIIKKYDLHPRTYSVHSFRSADSLARRIMIKHRGSIGTSHRYWYAIWDWKIDQVLERITREGLKLSALYGVVGATGDNWGFHWLKAVKSNFPLDYNKILEVFPLIEMEFFRYEKVKAHG